MLTTYRTKIRLLARIGAIIRPAKPLPCSEGEVPPHERSEYSWGRSAPLPYYKLHFPFGGISLGLTDQIPIFAPSSHANPSVV